VTLADRHHWALDRGSFQGQLTRTAAKPNREGPTRDPIYIYFWLVYGILRQLQHPCQEVNIHLLVIGLVDLSIPPLFPFHVDRKLEQPSKYEWPTRTQQGYAQDEELNNIK
jgi:hypothetical protein